MSTDRILYIDVTDGIPDEIPAGQNICFVFLPHLDYKGMYDMEEQAAKRGFGFMIIPITLPVLDLANQMEYAGVTLTEKLLTDIPRAIRAVAIEAMNQ